MIKRLLAVPILALSVAGSPAYATDWNIGNVHVLLIEGSYTPGLVKFSIDQNAGSSCPSGTLLNYNAQGNSSADRAANTAAVMSTLLTAKSTGNLIATGGANAGCEVAYVYMQ